MTKVSIVVPLYNVERYVGACLQSLLDQTFVDFEVLCIDDGSTDSTWEVAQETVRGDGRFFFCQQSNAGQSAARNRGIALAKSEYLLFLDSDDSYDPCALELLVAQVETNDLDLLCFAAETYYENALLSRTNYEQQSNRSDIDGVMTGEELYIRFEQTDSFRPSACLFMVARSLLNQRGISFKKGIIHEDLLLTMSVMPHARRAAFLNKPLYYRRMRPGSTMTSERGLRNITGLFIVQQDMDAWLRIHAEEYSSEFCDWYAHRVFDTRHDLARDILFVGNDQVSLFREGLSRRDRLEFDYIWEHAKYFDAAIHELCDSTTFKVGRALVSVPSWLKGHLLSGATKRS